MIQEIIEKIEREIELRKNMPHNYEQVDICHGLNLARDIVSAVQEPGWIPAEERLPDPDTEVLAQWEKTIRQTGEVYTYLDVLRVDGMERWYGDRGMPTGRVLAWMPLPEPYRPE